MNAAIHTLRPENQIAPFDAIANSYDETFTWSQIGQIQRSLVWQTLSRTFHRGDSVVDIGCGTGIDAMFLAERGIRVTAIDSARKMVEQTTRKSVLEGANHLITAIALPAERLEELEGKGVYDGALSNFGALNCIHDHQRFAQQLARLLRPGAMALLCLMNRVCIWEMVVHLSRGNAQKAFRRLDPLGSAARIGEGEIHVYYPSIASLRRSFAPHFRLAAVCGIGILVPPSYLEAEARRFPRLLHAAAACDAVLGRMPGFRICADHVLFSFERTET